MRSKIFVCILLASVSAASCGKKSSSKKTVGNPPVAPAEDVSEASGTFHLIDGVNCNESSRKFDASEGETLAGECPAELNGSPKKIGCHLVTQKVWYYGSTELSSYKDFEASCRNEFGTILRVETSESPAPAVEIAPKLYSAWSASGLVCFEYKTEPTILPKFDEGPCPSEIPLGPKKIGCKFPDQTEWAYDVVPAMRLQTQCMLSKGELLEP